MEIKRESAAASLVEVGRAFDVRGWVPASSGNFSVRLSTDRLAITASGKHKGALSVDDILTVDLQGRVIDGASAPSYETGLHTQLYRRDASIGSVLHTHSVHSTVLSCRAGQSVDLKGYELLKIFDGIKTHDAIVSIPVYENDQDITALANRIDDDMERDGMGHAYLIRGHGLYVWGSDVNITRHRVEALEFMLECENLSQGRDRK